jgi:cold shock CspA family protein
MDRSQGSFNKKEKEKKKLKKRQDKEKKKEERRASGDKEKSEDEMIAYVDAYGNISSTPPDPSQKKKINAADIQIGVPKREAIDPADLIRKGTVTFFNDSKGFGFIQDHESQERVFVHVNSLESPIKENDQVTFETERSPKGVNAVRVKLIK